MTCPNTSTFSNVECETQMNFWTNLIAAPPSVHRPEVVKVSHGKITLRLSRASERNGPISYYHLIVVPQKQHQHNIHKLPQDFTLEMVRLFKMEFDCLYFVLPSFQSDLKVKRSNSYKPRKSLSHFACEFDMLWCREYGENDITSLLSSVLKCRLAGVDSVFWNNVILARATTRCHQMMFMWCGGCS